MALDKDFTVIPFVGGLDEGKDAHVITQPLLKQSVNWQTDKEGALQVRDGSTQVAVAGPGDTRLFRYKDGAFVVSSTEYGSLDTETDDYRPLGDMSIGYKSRTTSVNSVVDGTQNTRLCALGPTGDRVLVASNSISGYGWVRLSLKVFNVASGQMLWEQNYDSGYLLDAIWVNESGRAIVAVRDNDNNLGNKGIRLYAISATTYNVVEWVIPTSDVEAHMGDPADNFTCRQFQMVPGFGSQVRFIANWMPRGPNTRTTYGATLYGFFNTAVTFSASIYNASNGDPANAATDGSAMVAIGYHNGVSHMLTCSQIDGYVRHWRVADADPSVIISPTTLSDGLRGYGPMWVAEAGDPPQVWEPSKFGSDARPTTTVGGTTEANGDAFNTTQSYGHSLMYGFVEYVPAAQRFVAAWHGVMQWATRRQVQVGVSRRSAWDLTRLLGTHVAVINETASVIDILDAPACHLLGRPNHEVSGSVDIPVAAASKWYATIRDGGDDPVGGLTTGFLTLREQLGKWRESDGGLQYSSGAIVRVDAINLDIHTLSLFGQDECAPHTSPIHVPHVGYLRILPEAVYPAVGGQWYSDGLLYGRDDRLNTDPRERFALFDISMAGTAVVGGEFVVGGTRWAAADISNLPGDARGLAKHEFAAPSSPVHPYVPWDVMTVGRPFGRSREFVSTFHRLTRPVVLSADAQDHVLIEAGTPLVFDGSSVFPWLWYIPPQPVLARTSNYRGKRAGGGAATEPRQMRVQACWFYTDAEGTKWRSAPSFVADYTLFRWMFDPIGAPPGSWDSGDDDPDANVTVFDRPMPLPKSLRGKFGIEYYMTQREEASEDNVTGDGPMALWSWSRADSEAADQYRDTIGDLPGQGVLATNGVGGVPVDPTGNMTELYRYAGLSLTWRMVDEYKSNTLLYTTGGVLEDEPPVGANYLTFAGGRVWYIRDGKAFFSKRVSKGKPIGFNANLFVDAPNGDELVAVSHVDENVVVFSRTSVFVCVGDGPNDLGSGPSYQAVPVASPVGCYNPNSVLSTEVGVFFAGPKTMYLLRRDMNVVRIGNVEDSLDVPRIRFAFQDRTDNRFFWYIGPEGGEDGYFVVFEAERGLWHTWRSPTENDLTSGMWTVNGTHYAQDDGGIRRVSSAAPKFSATLKTGWVHLGQTMGYKRFRNGYVGLRSGGPGLVVIAHSYDYDESFSDTRAYNLDAAGTHLLQFKPARQKCASYALSVTTGADVALTHLGIESGVKQLGHKIPR
jgi:hypothetical protein